MDGRKARARIIGSDPETDLAVIKVNMGVLPAMTFGHSDHAKVGDMVGKDIAFWTYDYTGAKA